MNPIPDTPVEYTDTDFATSTDRVRAARKALLDNQRAAEAHHALGLLIADRLDQKRATLSEVRRAVGLTQTQLAEMLDMDQGDISRLERRQNLHLTTLSRFIEATGGQLRITAKYGNTEIDLGIGDITPTEHTDEEATVPAS